MDSTIKKRFIKHRRIVSPYAYDDVTITTVFKTGQIEHLKCHFGESEQFLEVNGHVLDIPIREQFNEVVEIFTGTNAELLREV